MSGIFRISWRTRVISALSFALLIAMVSTSLALAASPNAVTLTRVSTDPYSNSTSQHKTEVEPDNFSFGSTIVSVFQAGRFFDGGSSNTGWATSINNGATWTHGFVPGTTVYATPKGKYARISDPSVAYDAKYGKWLIAGLALLVNGGGPFGAAVLVNQSSNGTTWSNPVTVASTTTQFFDKDWIVCDNTASSPHYGNCYAEWDNANNSDQVLMSTSSDGGNTWGAAKSPPNTFGLGGQPLVQPNGNVIVPFEDNAGNIAAFTSTNGGTNWTASVTVASVQIFFENANIRTSQLPSAEIDSSGKVYVVWQDCRFESGCSANDIVMSTSTNGTSWSAVTRVAADPVGSGVDHIIPGIAVDRATSGSTAHLAVTFYYFPVASCTSSCVLDVGFTSSTDGGSHWTAKLQLAGPMTLNQIASTNQGSMVGDYISTTILNGKTWPIFAVGKPPATGFAFNEAMYTVSGGLTVASGSNSSAGQVLVSSGHSPVISGRLTAF